MRLLVLGGTGFVGRLVVTEALARHAHVTVLNRGLRPPPSPGPPQRSATVAPPAAWTGFPPAPTTWSSTPGPVHPPSCATPRVPSRRAAVATPTCPAAPCTRIRPPPAPARTPPLVDGDPDATGDVAYAQAKRGAEIAVQDAAAERALLAVTADPVQAV